MPVIELRSADSYAEQLQGRRRGDRRPSPRAAPRSSASCRPRPRALGLQPIDDDALLDEVTGLVERPNVLACEFDPSFLDVPRNA